jgi:hypothetical protein
MTSRSVTWRPTRRGLLAALPVVAAVLWPLIYVWLTRPDFGFPLDDGWIHQTYARNLAARGRWEYVPGVVSAGSTAPLWTLLLAVGHALGFPGPGWAYFCGVGTLAGLALAGMALWRRSRPGLADRDWVVGLVLASSWPLVWASVSGMETLLFAALGVALCAAIMVHQPVHVQRHAAGAGLLGGFLILARPDGVLLVLLALLSLVSRRRQARRAVPAFVAALALPLVPYFAFNLSTSGALWPNTFYAKQAEYAAVLARPVWRRFIELLAASLGAGIDGRLGLTAAHLLLAPGLLFAGWEAARRDGRERRLQALIPLLWAGGHVALYAWRLPVVFQHARYLMPIMPIWIIAGLAGWVDLLGALGRRFTTDRRRWLLSRVVGLSFAAVLLFFLALGAGQYRVDVHFINGEMVTVARWLERHTPADALIAAHDIGAIGYIAGRPLLDLAGLISPEVVPLLDDERALIEHVRQSQAQYLVTAPGWRYEPLTTSENAVLVYQTDYLWTRQQGLNSMEVYRLVR